MKNEAFIIFLVVCSLSSLVLSYIVFAVFAESVRTVHSKINNDDKKKKKADESKAA